MLDPVALCLFPQEGTHCGPTICLRDRRCVSPLQLALRQGALRRREGRRGGVVGCTGALTLAFTLFSYNISAWFGFLNASSYRRWNTPKCAFGRGPLRDDESCGFGTAELSYFHDRSPSIVESPMLCVGRVAPSSSLLSGAVSPCPTPLFEVIVPICLPCRSWGGPAV